MPPDPRRPPASSAFWRRCGLAYLALVIYGSLYPFAWTRSTDGLFDWLLRAPPQRLSFTDVVVNVLAYVPLGFAFARLPLQTISRAVALAFGVGVGVAASLLVETLQVFVAGRNASNIDLLTNAVGSVIGAALATVFLPRSRSARLAAWRDRLLARGRGADVSLLAIAAWMATQLFPFVPSVDVSTVWESIAPLRQVIVGQRPLSMQALVENFLGVLAAVQLLSLVVKEPRNARRLAAVLILAVLAMKVFIVSRQLSAEAIAGALAALAAHGVLLRFGRAVRAVTAMVGVVLFILVNGTASGSHSATMAMNWIPFRSHLNNPLTGMAVIIEAAWPSLVLAAALHEITPSWNRRMAAWLAGLLLFAVVLAIEFAQQFIPGRVPDMTTPFVYGAVWMTAWVALLGEERGEKASPPNRVTP